MQSLAPTSLRRRATKDIHHRCLIGSQSDRRAIAGSENADHAGLADIAMNLAAKFGKLAGDELGRAMLLEAKLGVCVQVLPPGGHFAVKQIDEMWDLHGDRFRYKVQEYPRPLIFRGEN
jgi:hypothetical protein